MGYFIGTLWAEKSYLIPVLALGVILLQCGITRGLSAFKAFGIALIGLILGLAWALLTLEDMAAVVGLFAAGGIFFILYLLASLYFWRADRKKPRLPQRRARIMILSGLLLIGLTVFVVDYDKMVALRLKGLADRNSLAKFSEVLEANGDLSLYCLSDVWDHLLLLPPTPERIAMIKQTDKRDPFGMSFSSISPKGLLESPPSPARTELIKMAVAYQCERRPSSSGLSTFDFNSYIAFKAQGDYENASALIPCFIDRVIYYGYNTQLQYLLKDGADPNLHREDWTPLAEACEQNNTEAIKLLLLAGASRADAAEACEGKLPAVEEQKP